ncbi:MAG: hypothetical protein CVU13_10280 [Bacteroidetes bacterium HGW-Bacteroidetes-8]|nr:MAG: hypothetical protein CVU13_10280 [Bacteroidetes bacterium HGW-Bacteroidetes-8]
MLFMKKQSWFTKFKELFSWLIIVVAVLFLLSLFVFKDKLNNFASQIMVSQADTNLVKRESANIESKFNYIENKKDYKLTFLEFGAKNCSACKRMEVVMKEVSLLYENVVNVVFLNIMLPESQDLMKYYGIVSIPTQVILGRDGKEIFRHNGFYSTEDLKIVFDKNI